MIKTRCNRVTAWVMMGLLVVGLNVWFALPAMAAPITYVLGGGTATGGFVLDDTLPAPYVNWQINFGGDSFSLGTDLGQGQNVQSSPGVFDLATLNANGVDVLFFRASNISSSGGNYFTFIGDPATGEQGGFSPVGNPVPEMSPGVLFMIGLLVLAGARWWTQRREGLQRG